MKNIQELRVLLEQAREEVNTGVRGSALQYLDQALAALQPQWHTIDSAPACVPSGSSDNGLRPVIVCRYPINGRYVPMAIARLTSDGWITGKSDTKLWFEPTHWTELPTPPSGVPGLQPRLAITSTAA